MEREWRRADSAPRRALRIGRFDRGRACARTLAHAFQSYSALLTGDGEVPALLRAEATPPVIDLGHRDSRRAASRDGGISGQLSIREAGGTVRKWTAWRYVPLGLLVLPRATASAGH